MAKNGSGNERIVAERIARRECEKLGLKYEDALKGDFTTERPLRDRGRGQYNGFYRSPLDQYNSDMADAQATRRMSEELDKQMKEMTEMWEKRQSALKNSVRDKNGVSWKVSEISKLAWDKRMYLFGKDPLKEFGL